MDPELVERLVALRLDASMEQGCPYVAVPLDENGQPAGSRGDEWLVVFTGGPPVPVRLKPLADLWTGDVRPPDLGSRPPSEYLPFLATIERTAAAYVAATQTQETDQEFERLYSLLRRRPAGRDDHPLFGYLQAAVRLYMSLRATSQAEFEAVVRRLEQSARTFSEGYASTNYTRYALQPLIGSGR
ncbi:MAG: hypothetical protein AB7T63_06660 [Planctomycetota bacterium]